MIQKRSFRWTLSLGWASALGALMAGAGCSPSNSVQGGAAVLLSFGAAVPGAPYDPYGAVQYVPAAAAGAVMTVPPRAPFIALFDRLIDPDFLEDPDAGVAKPGLASATTALPGVTLDVSTVYAPGGDQTFHVFLPEGPSFTVNTTCGMPSGQAGSVALDMSKFLSHDQKTPVTLAAGVTSTLTFQTDPLSVDIGVPAGIPDPAGGLDISPGPAPAATSIDLHFNNMTPPMVPDACVFFPGQPSIAPNIHVTSGASSATAGPANAVISQDPMDPTHWVVAPPGTGPDGTGGAWTDGEIVTITVDAGAVDIFNRPIGKFTSGSFLVMEAM